MEGIILVASLIVAIIVGIITWHYSRKNLLEAQKQSQLALEAAKRDLEKSNTALKETEGKLLNAKRYIPKDIEIISDINDAIDILNMHLQENAQKAMPVEVKVMGLDLQSVMPWFMTKIIHADTYDNAYQKYKMLLVDPKSPDINALINGHSNISEDAVNNSIKSALSINDIPDVNKLSFEMRQYQYLPIIHGLMINNEYLGLAFSQVENGKLLGGIYPYMFIKRDNTSKFTKHCFDLFNGWFNFYWKNSNEIINIAK